MFLFYVLVLSAAAVCAARPPRQPPQPLLSSHDLIRRQSGGLLYGNDTGDSPYWLGNMLRQGKAPFHMAAGNDTMGNYTTGSYTGTNSTGSNSTGKYLIFRNVKNYGARGKLIFFFDLGHRYMPSSPAAR